MLEEVHQPAASLHRLLTQGSANQESIEDFLGDHSFPLQEGDVTTFVFHGEADLVELRHWIEGAPDLQPFERIDKSNLWHLSVHLPAESRIEYKLEIAKTGDRELIFDPLNPLLAHDPFGANSVCYGAGYTIPDWTLPDPAATPGRIEHLELESRAFGDRRQFGLYLPAGYDKKREYPLLLVHDGRDFVRYSGLKTVLDNLIHRGEIAPLVVGLTEPVDRLREYAGDPRHAFFLTEELLPYLGEHYQLSNSASDRGLMGASFGAVASLYTAWRYPMSFGRLLLQSGSFVATRRGGRRRGPEFRPVVAFTQLFRTSPRQVTEMAYVSCGLFESLCRRNRELVPLLEDAGIDVRYTEVLDGHNWENWRDRMREALVFLFPGPAAPPPAETAGDNSWQT